MKSIHKRLTFEDKFARKFYCNSYRFTNKVKKANRKKMRRILKDNLKAKWEQYD